MRSREEFIKLVDQGEQKFSLKMRLCLIVTLEMLVCVGITFGLDALFNTLMPTVWKVPLAVEMIVICLLVGILVTRFLSKMFFEPIKNLRKAMEKVADGDFTVRLTDKTSSKEIKEVYTGFNFMASELNSTEILQSDFVSNVSHEFKTPISAIEGYSTLLQNGDNLDESQKEYVEKIIYNTKRLSNLAGNVLLLSKIENQNIPTNKKQFDLAEQIRQSLLSFEQLWEQKQLEFDVDLDDVSYFGSENLLHHVWDNLISNAIKFSPEGGTIKISLKKDKKKIVFAIEDEGPGIDENVKRHIFDKFYQADTSHKAEGNGLGLALTKRIVDLEGGEIEVSNGEKSGCKFTVILKTKL